MGFVSFLTNSTCVACVAACSAIFATSEAQYLAAQRSARAIAAVHHVKGPIVTTIHKAHASIGKPDSLPDAQSATATFTFWPAEDYHQRYLEKKGQAATKGALEAIRCYG